MTVGDLTSLCRDPCDGSGCWRADCRSACYSTARAGGDPIPVAARCGAAVAPRGAAWSRVEPPMVCDVRVTNLDLGRWARFPVAFVRWRTDRSVDDCGLE